MVLAAVVICAAVFCGATWFVRSTAKLRVTLCAEERQTLERCHNHRLSRAAADEWIVAINVHRVPLHGTGLPTFRSLEYTLETEKRNGVRNLLPTVLFSVFVPVSSS